MCHEHMKLSVIIVNYNVRAYLEQCLRSVFEAMKGLTATCSWWTT
jgi:glycosyltransferase involved in cell wall biosynthesis